MRRIAVSLVTAVLLLVGGIALAGSGAVSDGNDSDGGFDFQQVRHSNTNADISYEADFYDDPYTVDGGPSGSEENTVDWSVDFNGSGKLEAEVICDIPANRGNPRCAVYHDDVKLADAIGQWVDNNTMRVTYSRSVFNNVEDARGRCRYEYDVHSKFNGASSNSFALDWVPDAGDAVHDLCAGATGATGSPTTATTSPGTTATTSPGTTATSSPGTTPTMSPGTTGTAGGAGAFSTIPLQGSGRSATSGDGVKDPAPQATFGAGSGRATPKRIRFADPQAAAKRRQTVSKVMWALAFAGFSFAAGQVLLGVHRLIRQRQA